MKYRLPFKTHIPLTWVIALCLSLGSANISAQETPSSQTTPPIAATFHTEGGFLPQIAQRLEDYLRQQVGEGNMGGVVVRVDMGSATLRGAVGYSKLDSCCYQQYPRNFLNKFRMGSISKIYTASVVLSLVDQKHIRLEDTLEKWFSNKKQHESWYSKLPSGGDSITVRQLLNMTAPLGNYYPSVVTSYACTPLEIYTPGELLELGFQQPPPQKCPNFKFGYSNTNYILLGLLIEEATQKTVQQNLEELIFKPLKLSNTLFAVKAAMPYDYDGGYGLFKETPKPDPNESDYEDLLEMLWQSGLIQLFDDMTHEALPEPEDKEKSESQRQAYNKILRCQKDQTYSSIVFKPLEGHIMNEITFSSPTIPWTAGAIVTTVDEMLIALKAQVKGEIPSLSQATLDARYENANKMFMNCGKKFSYGLGIMEFGSYKGHDGAISGYTSSAFYSPEKNIGVSVNVNMNPPAPELNASNIALNIIHLIEKGTTCPKLNTSCPVKEG